MDNNNNNNNISNVRYKGIIGNIFRNVTNDEAVFYNCSISRAYKKSDNEWAYSSTFGETDLLVLAEVAKELFKKIQEFKKQDNNNNNN